LVPRCTYAASIPKFVTGAILAQSSCPFFNSLYRYLVQTLGHMHSSLDSLGRRLRLAASGSKMVLTLISSSSEGPQRPNLWQKQREFTGSWRVARRCSVVWEPPHSPHQQQVFLVAPSSSITGRAGSGAAGTSPVAWTSALAACDSAS